MHGVSDTVKTLLAFSPGISDRQLISNRIATRGLRRSFYFYDRASLTDVCSLSAVICGKLYLP
jgi:hypothetical protein